METPGPIIEDYCGHLTNQRSVLRPVDQTEASIQHYLVRLPELQLELVTRDTLVGLEPSRELLPGTINGEYLGSSILILIFVLSHYCRIKQ